MGRKSSPRDPKALGGFVTSGGGLCDPRSPHHPFYLRGWKVYRRRFGHHLPCPPMLRFRYLLFNGSRAVIERLLCLPTYLVAVNRGHQCQCPGRWDLLVSRQGIWSSRACFSRKPIFWRLCYRALVTFNDSSSKELYRTALEGFLSILWPVAHRRRFALLGLLRNSRIGNLSRDPNDCLSGCISNGRCDLRCRIDSPTKSLS